VPEPNYESMVLRELSALREEMAEVRAEMVGVRIDVATLKVKSGLWGAGAGFVPAALIAVMAVTTGGS
jgi:hypothetical protein